MNGFLSFTAITLGMMLVGAVFNLAAFFLRPITYGRNNIIILILILSGIMGAGIAVDYMASEMEVWSTVPLGLSEISFWMAITSIILFAATEFLRSQDGQIREIIETERLKTLAHIFSIQFLLTVAIRVYQDILTQ